MILVLLACADHPSPELIHPVNMCKLFGPYEVDGAAGLETACDLPCDPMDLKGTLQVDCDHTVVSLEGLGCFRDVRHVSISGCRHILNMEGLSGLRRVGVLGIGASEDLVDLRGLEGVTAIGEEVHVGNARGLQSLEGFSAVTEFGVTAELATIWIDDVPALTSLSGLEQLLAPDVVRPEGGLRLFVVDAPALVDVRAAAGAGDAPVEWYLSDLDILTDLTGLDAPYVSEAHLRDLPLLTTLQGLDAVSMDALELYHLPLLTSLAGLPTYTVGTFTLGRRVDVAAFDAPNLSWIGALVIDNGSVRSLAGLNGVHVGAIYAGQTNLDSLAGPAYPSALSALELTYDDRLLDVDGLEAVTAINGRLLLSDNHHLRSLAGLMNLRSVSGDVIITDNPQLRHDEIVAFIEALGVDHIGGKLHIDNNGK